VDLLDPWAAAALDPAHIRDLFAAMGGTHVREAVDAYWLYHAEGFDEQPATAVLPGRRFPD
jgi:hypothetical protein